MKRRNSETPNGSRGLDPWLPLFCGAALLFGVLIGWSLAPVGVSVRSAPSGSEQTNRQGGQIPVVDSDVSTPQDADSEVAEMDEAEMENEDTEQSVAEIEDPAIQAWINAVASVVAAQDAGKRPSAASVASFKAAFDALTDEQKTECLPEALNLFADESVDCLSAILLDSKEPEDLLQSVLGDILARPSEVKDPVLRTLAADSSHPLAGEAGELLESSGKRFRRSRRASRRD